MVITASNGYILRANRLDDMVCTMVIGRVVEVGLPVQVQEIFYWEG